MMSDPRYKELILKSKRTYKIFCKNLDNGNIIKQKENEIVEAASTIKLPILALILSKFQDGNLSLRMPVKIKRSQVGRNGSGILQYFYLDRPLTLYNVVLLMIIESDNVATNVVIDLLSKEAINKYIKDIGLKNTKLLMNKLDFADDYTFKKGMLAETSASDMGIFLEKLIQGELLNEGYTKMSLNILEHTQNSNFKKLIDINKFKKYGNKTGSMWDEKEKRIILNDCGFVFGKKGQRCIFSVFSEGPGDSQIPYSNFSKSRVEFAKVSKSIFDELNKT